LSASESSERSGCSVPSLADITAIYLGLSLLGAFLFWLDCTSEPSLSPPGDSLIAYLAFHHIGGLLWIVAWLATSRRAIRSIVSYRWCDVAAGAITLAAVSCFRTRIHSVAPETDDWLFSSVLWSLLVFFVLPGVRGSLWGIRMSNYLHVSRGAGTVRFLVVSLATLTASTFLWWPYELGTAIGCLINVRGIPSDWTREWLWFQVYISGGLGVVAMLAASLHWLSRSQGGK